MTVSEKNFPGRHACPQGGDCLVGAVNHHGIRRGEPRGGKFDRRLHPGAQPGRQAGEELIDLAEAGAREFDQIAAAEEQTADQTLQGGMGRVAADHMQDEVRGERLRAGRAVIKPPVKGAGVPQLRRDPREEVAGGGRPEQCGEKFRGAGDGLCSFCRVHKVSHSSAAREQPRGRAEGSRPSNSKASPRLTARSCVRIPTTEPTLAPS